MTSTYIIDPATKLCVEAFFETLTGAEMLESTAAVRNDPEFRPGFSQLIYIPQETDVTITTAELQAFSVTAPSFSPTSRRVICMQKRDPVLFGTARMFQQLRSDAGQFRLCHELEDAATFLDLPLETLQGYLDKLENER